MKNVKTNSKHLHWKQNHYKTPTVDTLKESIAIAPGEGTKPISILNHVYCEEMAHPHLFQTGKFGYNVKRDVYFPPNTLISDC